MECNREEAVKARGIAEQKMQDGDLEGAKKFALKAQKLFPELENILQLLMVCNVHYSAKNKLSGSEMDWYGVLQIEQSADEASIKKQYRRLALLLHPDKNKFSGAEAAFKLIGEANTILSDQTKRSQYDLKCRILVKTTRKPASCASKKASSRPSKKASVNGQHEFTNSDQNGSSKFTASHAYQQAQHQTFWTLCSACGIKYQYYKDFINKLLLCPTCGFQFIAFDLGPQGPCNSGVQFRRGVAPKDYEDFTAKQNVDGFPNTRDEKKGGDMPMPKASEPKESGTSGNDKKRGRKTVEVSDESRETETADAVGRENCGLNSKANASHPRKKSTKQKPITDYFSWQKRA
ncbi:Bifunctional 3-dehydroquinate dehydratase/shikimate dehydrogenase isoform 1 [Hibiscus syriacus]|uniref:Bifunctional 3-dehydroquinate dehydratase/shikimate dehydrogenase isoform 1 n=1 Tax=Hibiscus syriacus TaxID=106335 RepID=A0A6A3A806_HIBSY|nr:Bifunctional 3-dehydroquinate dehydratase/shikimate dehydrogenase isoform 1 [Hibiscus syriacus]